MFIRKSNFVVIVKKKKDLTVANDSTCCKLENKLFYQMFVENIGTYVHLIHNFDSILVNGMHRMKFELETKSKEKFRYNIICLNFRNK